MWHRWSLAQANGHIDVAEAVAGDHQPHIDVAEVVVGDYQLHLDDRQSLLRVASMWQRWP